MMQAIQVLERGGMVFDVVETQVMEWDRPAAARSDTAESETRAEQGGIPGAHDDYSLFVGAVAAMPKYIIESCGVCVACCF